MAKERVEYPSRPCDNCSAGFVPSRRTQRFCSRPCRKSWHLTEYRVAPHPCPLCTTVHDPEEKSVIDALEILVRDGAMPGTGGNYDQLWADDVRQFIDRRRAILRGEAASAVAAN